MNNNYTVLYAPPEMVSCNSATETAQPGAPHDMWALGILFQQLLTATGQDIPWFLPNIADVGGIEDVDQRTDALHSAVAIQHNAWVRCLVDNSWQCHFIMCCLQSAAEFMQAYTAALIPCQRPHQSEIHVPCCGGLTPFATVN